jgi:hypothetical protein
MSASALLAEPSVKEQLSIEHVREHASRTSLDYEDDQLIEEGPINYENSSLLITQSDENMIARSINQFLLRVGKFLGMYQKVRLYWSCNIPLGRYQIRHFYNPLSDRGRHRLTDVHVDRLPRNNLSNCTS